MESYEVALQRQADELDLISVSRARRDEVVRRARANGMSQYRIRQLSGLHALTIRRILAPPEPPLPEDVPVCTRMDEDLPQAVRRPEVPDLAGALRASLDRAGRLAEPLLG